VTSGISVRWNTSSDTETGAEIGPKVALRNRLKQFFMWVSFMAHDLTAKFGSNWFRRGVILYIGLRAMQPTNTRNCLDDVE